MQTKPDWLDTDEYPFKSNYIEIDGHKMHYVDEGSGPILLMVHGIPDWSFSYRNIIKLLSYNYRCIAADNLGYGLSEKPGNADYSHKAHAQRLTQFIEKLHLKNINILVHDFGGPMGLAYAEDHPENIDKIIILNSWMWSLKGDKHFETGAKLVNSWLGKFLYLKMNFSVNFMVKQSFADKKKLTKNIFSHYKKPQDAFGRKANYRLAQDLTGAHAWHNSIYEQREKLLGKSVLIIWGMADKFFPAQSMLAKWQQTLPNAKIIKMENAGHFVQEEVPEQMANEIREFLPEY